MAKNKIVIANHKMNMLSSDINIYLKKIKEQINIENVIICPSCIYIPYFLKQNFKVGIQNIFYKSKGAYTGEISPRQAKSMEVDYAIVGHSERRKYFLETNNEINQKIELCLKNNLKVILCIGENKEEKYEGKTKEVLESELVENLANISNLEDVIIAYEPIWAIGTGRTATAEQANETIGYIRSVIERAYGREVAEAVRIQYGGSVNPSNIKELMAQEHIDGALVGGASLDPKSFLSLVNYQG